MPKTVLKAETLGSSGPLMGAYTSSEVANNARSAPRKGGLDAPSIQKPTLIETLVRGFKQFLGIPFAICAGAAGLAILLHELDRSTPDWAEGFRSWLTDTIFTQSDPTVGSLDLMAAGMFGLSTITFSMLLIALQQSAGATGVQVADGFLSRKRNQSVLGYLLGVTIFVVVTRVLGESDLNPALGAFASLLFTLTSVFVLAVLFFMVSNQSRPNFIVDDMRMRTLMSRRRTHDYLRKTRRTSALPDMPFREVLATGRGYVSKVDFEALSGLAARNPSGEIELVCEIGDYLIHGDPIARIRGLDGLTDAQVRETLSQDSERSVQHDPTSGLTNLRAMSWRTGSAAQQNQETTVNAINALSDLFIHWLHDEPILNGGSEWNVVYPDTALFQFIDTMEHQFAVASESTQPMPVAQIYSVVARTLDRMSPEVMDRVADMVVRSLTTLKVHYLTLNLEQTLLVMAEAFRKHGRVQTAARIEDALKTKREADFG